VVLLVVVWFSGGFVVEIVAVYFSGGYIIITSSIDLWWL